MRRSDICTVLLVLGLAAPAFAKNKEPEIPPDTAEYFLKRYERFVLKDERKQIEKINKALKKQPGDSALITERDRLIAEFWSKRDINPATPENEFKTEVDGRIDDIAIERLASGTGTPGLKFIANGGFHGDMARVYLLHGLPDSRGWIKSGRLVTDLMLWLYLGADGRVVYAFLFYGQDRFLLFPQDVYAMNPYEAVGRILLFRGSSFQGYQGGGVPSEVAEAIRELQSTTDTNGVPGNVYLWALVNFSQDPTLHQGQALEPPLPVAAVLAEAPSRVVGEAETSPSATTKLVPASCGDGCNSMIPIVAWHADTFTLRVRRSALDWASSPDSFSAVLKVRLVLEREGSDVSVVLERFATINGSQELLSRDPDGVIVIRVLKDQEIASIASGTYRVSVYVRSVLTNRYNALDVVVVLE